jgi:hypothetical protein
VYPSSSPRRIGPVLILVLVLLAGLAATGGYLGARRILAGQAGGATVTPPVTTPTPTPSVPDVTGNPNDPGTFCPAITERAVAAAGLRGELQLLLYVEAKGTSADVVGAEAWVCQNADGVLVYQGHRKTGPFNAATSDHTLLLGTGIRGKVSRDGNGFVALNPKDPNNLNDTDHTDYHVSSTEFYYIHFPNNARTTYSIVRTVP